MCSKLSDLHLHHFTWIFPMSASTGLKQLYWKKIRHGLFKWFNQSKLNVYFPNSATVNFFLQNTKFWVNGSPDCNALRIWLLYLERIHFPRNSLNRLLATQCLTIAIELNQRLLSCIISARSFISCVNEQLDFIQRLWP